MTTDQVQRFLFIDKPRRFGGRRRWSTAGIVGAFGLYWSLSMGFNTVPFWSSSVSARATVKVDRGDVAQVVVEYGSLECSDDDVVRCQVESFLALPVAAPVANGQSIRAPAPRSRTTSKASSSASRSTTTASTGAAVKGKAPGKARGEQGQSSAKSGRSRAATVELSPRGKPHLREDRDGRRLVREHDGVRD